MERGYKFRIFVATGFAPAHLVVNHVFGWMHRQWQELAENHNKKEKRGEQREKLETNRKRRQ